MPRNAVRLFWVAFMVGTGGIEPPTPSVSGKCSPTELRACNQPRRFVSNRHQHCQAILFVLFSFFLNSAR